MRHRDEHGFYLLLLIFSVSIQTIYSGFPHCQGNKSVFDEYESEVCRQGLQTEGWPSSCEAGALEECCAHVQWLLKQNCHCWTEITTRQKSHSQSIHAECEAAGFFRDIRKRPEEVKLFVGVLTAARNYLARQAIRDTWGSDPRLHRVLFFSAKPKEERIFDALRKEASIKLDVVILPSIWESYFNITHQTLEVIRAAALDRDATHTLKVATCCCLQAKNFFTSHLSVRLEERLSWIHHGRMEVALCVSSLPNSKLPTIDLMNVDDDSYVRVGDVLSRIRRAPSSRLFLGYIENPGGGPHRDPGSQWYVAPEEWPSERYPPWAHGAGYVISQDLVQEIAAGAALKPDGHRLFKLEDIAVGSWIEFVAQEQKWEVNYVQDVDFNFNGCTAYDAISHYVKPKAMRCIYKNRGRCCRPSSLSKPHIRGGGWQKF